MQYCEDKTQRAVHWYAHAPRRPEGSGAAKAAGPVIFGTPARLDDSPYTYAGKPMVAVAWQEAEELCGKLSSAAAQFRLPTEAEWEKAARGGLVGRRYAWGGGPPTGACCDFGRFDEFSILPSRTFPPNGYGLYAMCGSVWEWTADRYDALAYAGVPVPEALAAARATDGPGARDARNAGRVLRGGSWADSAEAVTVSFRMARASSGWREGAWTASLAPCIGFRIARVER